MLDGDLPSIIASLLLEQLNTGISTLKELTEKITETINILDDKNTFSILLSHHPELFPEYKNTDIDLVFSGHAHGGQFRLPFIGGIIAPEQGLFPEYDAGIYTEDNTNMLVSRGIGNSILPFRINNRPEVILINLQAE